MRYQAATPGVVTIYGPPGTKRTVDALNAAMAPFVDARPTMARFLQKSPAESVQVIELTDGSKVTIGKVSVTAAVNSRYSFTPGSADAERFQSLSYRFDTPDRSIVYTGDTGPSPNVERLAQNADLLVSEIMDPDAALAELKEARPDLPFFVVWIVERHFRKEHLSPDEVGLLAERSGAKALVLTHDAADQNGLTLPQAAIATHFKGSIIFANDLDTF